MSESNSSYKLKSPDQLPGADEFYPSNVNDAPNGKQIAFMGTREEYVRFYQAHSENPALESKLTGLVNSNDVKDIEIRREPEHTQIDYEQNSNLNRINVDDVSRPPPPLYEPSLTGSEGSLDDAELPAYSRDPERTGVNPRVNTVEPSGVISREDSPAQRLVRMDDSPRTRRLKRRPVTQDPRTNVRPTRRRLAKNRKYGVPAVSLNVEPSSYRGRNGELLTRSNATPFNPADARIFNQQLKKSGITFKDGKYSLNGTVLVDDAGPSIKIMKGAAAEIGIEAARLKWGNSMKIGAVNTEDGREGLKNALRYADENNIRLLCDDLRLESIREELAAERGNPLPASSKQQGNISNPARGGDRSGSVGNPGLDPGEPPPPYLWSPHGSDAGVLQSVAAKQAFPPAHSEAGYPERFAEYQRQNGLTDAKEAARAYKERSSVTRGDPLAPYWIDKGAGSLEDFRALQKELGGATAVYRHPTLSDEQGRAESALYAQAFAAEKARSEAEATRALGSNLDNPVESPQELKALGPLTAGQLKYIESLEHTLHPRGEQADRIAAAREQNMEFLDSPLKETQRLTWQRPSLGPLTLRQERYITRLEQQVISTPKNGLQVSEKNSSQSPVAAVKNALTAQKSQQTPRTAESIKKTIEAGYARNGMSPPQAPLVPSVRAR